MSDNTAPEVATFSVAEDLRNAAIWVEIGSIGFAKEYAGEILALEKRIQGYATALDALREAVKGCGRTLPDAWAGVYPCGWEMELCGVCEIKRDAAISSLQIPGQGR